MYRSQILQILFLPLYIVLSVLDPVLSFVSRKATTRSQSHWPGAAEESGHRFTLFYKDQHAPSYRRYTSRLAKSKTKKDSSEEEELTKILDSDPKFLERNKHWVVIVDDEEAIRIAVGDFLYDHGYQVTACADADALLQVCNTPREEGELVAAPAAIVSDIRMPGKDGIELLGLIREDDRLERVPVILLTAKGMTEDRVEGYKAGCDFYLPKPFNPDELLSILDNAILRRRQMTGEKGGLVDLKQELADIKQLMKQNEANTVKKTDIYLTLAEREVLTLLSKGYTNAEIAKERGVSLAVVIRAIQKLYSITFTRTRTELVRWGIDTGYVPKR